MNSKSIDINKFIILIILFLSISLSFLIYLYYEESTIISIISVITL